MGGQRVIVSGVSERCRAREGVAVMLSGRMWGKVAEYKCLNSRIMWVKLKLDGEIIVVVSVYAPGMEKNEDERERFWASLNECLVGFGSNERVIVSGASERCRAREGVAVMLSGHMWGKVAEYMCLNSRIMWVKLKLDGEFVVIVSVYVPGMEKN